MSDSIGITIETAAGSIGATVTVNKAAYREAMDMLDAALRENDRAKAMEARGRLSSFGPILMARVEELEKALQPFAAIAQHFDDVGQDDGMRPTVAELRRAKEVLG